MSPGGGRHHQLYLVQAFLAADHYWPPMRPDSTMGLTNCSVLPAHASPDAHTHAISQSDDFTEEHGNDFTEEHGLGPTDPAPSLQDSDSHTHTHTHNTHTPPACCA